MYYCFDLYVITFFWIYRHNLAKLVPVQDILRKVLYFSHNKHDSVNRQGLVIKFPNFYEHD